MNAVDLTPASLLDPLYYLHNARTLLRWSLEHHGDLLLESERLLIRALLAEDDAAQALLVRMVMRKGERFRTDALDYAEIGPLSRPLAALVRLGAINLNPSLDLAALGELCRRPDLRDLAGHWLQKPPAASISKKQLMAHLEASPAADRVAPWRTWWPGAPCDLVQLTCSPLFERIRLMFFGNLHQDWSEFVLTELGHQQYEAVALDPASRAFAHREEVDLYLQIHHCHKRLEEGESVETIEAQLPPASANPWLENRRQRLLFALGQQAERSGERQQALCLYRQSGHRQALIRELRLLEKQAPPREVFERACQALETMRQPETRISIGRILGRAAKKAGLALDADLPLIPAPAALPSQTLTLPRVGGERVEQAVINHLSQGDDQVHYVENRLFTGLFALLFWPALFEPVPGAFFHPFQAGPADLYREDFPRRRRAALEAGFAALSDGRYRRVILERMQAKRGLRCTLAHWPTLEEPLVRGVLAVIPAAHLDAVFRHLLLDLRHHCRGMPDLIRLNPVSGEYTLIEVKGPGDRLQDHQRLWMGFCLDRGLPVRVCHVRWDDAPETH